MTTVNVFAYGERHSHARINREGQYVQEHANPFVHIELATGQTIPNSSFERVEFDTVISDHYGLVKNLGTNTTQIEIQQPGIYLFSVYVTLNAPATGTPDPRTITIVKESPGVTVIGSDSDYTVNQISVLRNSSPIELVAGDIIYVTVFQLTGANLDIQLGAPKSYLKVAAIQLH